MISQEGAILVPEIDEELLHVQPGNSAFFENLKHADEETISKAVDRLDLNLEDGDEDEDCGSFEEKALRMTDVLPDGGVKKKIIKPGLECDGVVPEAGTVTVHYSLFLEDQDEPYDSSKVRGKCERFKLDDGQLFVGLELAIKTMKKREKAEFLIQPSYAFGPMGCPPRIPGNSQIMAIIEMLDFVQVCNLWLVECQQLSDFILFFQEGKADSLLSLGSQERSQKYGYDDIEKVASHEHKEGNILTRNKEFKLAARRYERGCKLLEEIELKNDEEEERQKHLLVKLYLNRAHCYLNIQWPKKACLALQSALDLEPDNAKALYRMGRAKRDLANFDDARRFFLKAQAVSDDPAIGRELTSLNKYLKDDKNNQKALYKRMMNNAGDTKAVSGEIKATDDDYEEISQQLRYFKENPRETELILPSGMDQNDIRVARIVASKLGGLELRELRGRKQWKIVKVWNQFKLWFKGKLTILSSKIIMGNRSNDAYLMVL